MLSSLVLTLLLAPVLNGSSAFAIAELGGSFALMPNSSSGSEFLSRLERAEASFDPGCERYLALADKASLRRLKTFPDLTGEAARARFAAQQPDLMLFAIQTSLAEALRTSRELSRRLVSSTDDPASQFYDAIFIGAGSAELTAQLTLRKNGLRLKTLTIEADEAVARTFYSTRAYYLNSTDGPSEGDGRPLPNQGRNLNKIPSGFVQTSNVQGSGKYATAGVLGDILNVNRFLLPAPILFGERVVAYRPTSAARQRLGYPRLTVTLASGRELFGNFVFEGTGLGIERSSASSAEGRAFIESDWDRFVNTGEAPRYFTALRLFNFITHARRPYLPFVGKEITIVGDGDFAKVIWEYLERQGPPNCYRDDTAEDGRSRAGNWLAAGIVDSCKGFVGASRGRYLLSIPAALQKGRIRTVDGRSLDVRPLPDGRVRVTYRGPDGAVRSLDTDIVIDAIGFARDKLVDVAATDVVADLPDTGPAVVGRATYPGAYLFGVASGAPVTAAELAGNDENRASLFLNLVRVEATINAVTKDYVANPMFTPTPARPRKRVEVSDKRAHVQVDLINPDGFVQDRDFAREFANAQVEAAVRELRLPVDAVVGVAIAGKRIHGSSRFQINGVLNGRRLAPGPVKRLTQALTATPAFLSVLDEQLDRGPMIFDWSFTARGESLDLVFGAQAGDVDVEPVERRLLKGFRPPTALRYQDAQPASVPSATPIEDPVSRATGEIRRRLPTARIKSVVDISSVRRKKNLQTYEITVTPPDKFTSDWLFIARFSGGELTEIVRRGTPSIEEADRVKEVVRRELPRASFVRLVWSDFGWIVTIREEFKVDTGSKTFERDYRLVPPLNDSGLALLRSAEVTADRPLAPEVSPPPTDETSATLRDIRLREANDRQIAEAERFIRKVLPAVRVEDARRVEDDQRRATFELTVTPFVGADFTWVLVARFKGDKMQGIGRQDPPSEIEAEQVRKIVLNQRTGLIGVAITWKKFAWLAKALEYSSQNGRRVLSDVSFRIRPPLDAPRVQFLGSVVNTRGLPAADVIEYKRTFGSIASDYVRDRLPRGKVLSGVVGRRTGEIEQSWQPLNDRDWVWKLTMRIADGEVVSVERQGEIAGDEYSAVAARVASKLARDESVREITWSDFAWRVDTSLNRQFKVTLINGSFDVRVVGEPSASTTLIQGLLARDSILERFPQARIEASVTKPRPDIVGLRVRPFVDRDWVWDLSVVFRGEEIFYVGRTNALDVKMSSDSSLKRIRVTIVDGQPIKLRGSNES